jgi:hypothetical protein
MLRAWVALAAGKRVVDGRSHSSKVGTFRRPSSFASINPAGPPPAMITAASRFPAIIRR